MQISSVLVAAAVAALVSVPAAANPLSRILAKSGLTAQDTNVMRRAEQTLLEEPRNSGNQVRWRNPASGAEGVVRLGNKQDDCRYLLHQVQLKDVEEPKQLRRKFCKTDSGWLLSQ